MTACWTAVGRAAGGYAAAEDRLLQMEPMRRQAAVHPAEVFESRLGGCRPRGAHRWARGVRAARVRHVAPALAGLRTSTAGVGRQKLTDGHVDAPVELAAQGEMTSQVSMVAGGGQCVS